MSAFSSVAAKSFGAALMLSAAMATPVFAQAAISEPGAYSFYHPDGDVLHVGSGAVRSVPNALAMAPLGGERLRHHAHHAAHR
jgi:hypothetical protein